MRLSDADRELLLERLKRHAAAGRLGIEELERRVVQIETAETREEAAAALADLPPLPADPSSVRRRVRVRGGHGDADAPAPDWSPTNERFRDPRTKRVMRVWVDTAGGRHYVVDDEL